MTKNVSNGVIALLRTMVLRAVSVARVAEKRTYAGVLGGIL